MARVYRKGNTWVCSNHGPVTRLESVGFSCGCPAWGVPGRKWYATVKPLNLRAKLPSVNRRDAK